MSARYPHPVSYLKARQQPKVAEKQNKTEKKTQQMKHQRIHSRLVSLTLSVLLPALLFLFLSRDEKVLKMK